MINKYDIEFKKKLLDFSFKKVELKRVSLMNSLFLLLLFLTGLDNSVMNAKLMKKPMMNTTIWKKTLDFVKNWKMLKKKMNS